MEMLVVIGVFAALAAIATQSILLSVKGTRKAEATGKLRGNLEYALGVMERRLRMATDVGCLGNPDQIDFYDEADSWAVGAVYYLCDIAGSDDNITTNAYSGGLLDTNTVDLTACSFTCDDLADPRTLTISLSANEQNVTGVESAQVDVSTTIVLRNR